jgi:hypothetical protein
MKRPALAMLCATAGCCAPALIHKTEPEPIRIFLQDGKNDHMKGGGGVGAGETTKAAVITIGNVEGTLTSARF